MMPTFASFASLIITLLAVGGGGNMGSQHVVASAFELI